MPEPVEPPAPPTEPPAPSLDEASIGELIEAKVKALFASQPKPPAEPAAAPAGDPVDIEAKVAAAVQAAMSKRDEEDQIFVLDREIKKIQADFAGLSAPRKRGWADRLLGPFGANV